jgi:hypothetical protein
MPHRPPAVASGLCTGRMEVQQRMRWRQSFIAEISKAVQRLGLRACPVCGSASALGIDRSPVFLLTGGPPARDDPALGEDCDYDLALAVRIECSRCGHLMLFNADQYHTEGEQVLVREAS